jgi:hypothetical protein
MGYTQEDVMRNIGKKLLFVAIIYLCVTGYVFSGDPLEGFQDAVAGFSKKLAAGLPFNSTIGLNWADAYIGQLIGLPPHFGIGVTTGATIMDFHSINDLLGQFGMDNFLDANMLNDIPGGNLLGNMINNGGIPLPGYTIEARVGGIILPFDVGFKFGYLPLHLDVFNLDYLLVGGDVRYALLNGKGLLPAVSVGVGYNYLKGNISLTAPIDNMNFTFPDQAGGTSHTLAISTPELGLLWESSMMEVKAQISKSFFIVTPYLGIGFGHSWAKAGYEIESNVTLDGNSINDAADAILDQLGDLGIANITNNGFSSMFEKNGWTGRLFGGLSLNIAVIRLDFTAMYSFFDKKWGGTIGLRFQL